MFFFSKMRSGADKIMVLPFEIEGSNSICEQRRYRCTELLVNVFQIPSHFCARNIQSLAIFKTEKTGFFFCDNQFYEKHMQKKEKKKGQ